MAITSILISSLYMIVGSTSSSFLRFDLKNLNFIDIESITDSVASSVLDVRSECLYYINQNGGNVRVMSEFDNDCTYDNFNEAAVQGTKIHTCIKITNSIGAELALDDGGLYVVLNNRDEIVRYRAEDIANQDEYAVPTQFINNLQSIEATSPGTQPLPQGISFTSS